MKNAIRPGDLTPSQVVCTASNTGDLSQCLEKVQSLARWNEETPTDIKPDTVRVKGISCFWKTENPPTDAISGALVTFNPDGSLNLQTGVVEMGCGGQTHLAQMLAERLKIDAGRVHVVSSVDTRINPQHWKTVARLTEFMAVSAVMRSRRRHHSRN
jgi:CO/xanthine dehydrogenase Mo-binding subunit